MKTAAVFLAAIALAGGVAAASTTIASNDLLAKQVTDELRPAGNTVDGTGGLGYLALALSSGNQAMRSLRGTASNYDEKDTLSVSIPNMDCSMDRIANYVSCYSDTLSSKEDANRVFTRYIDELQSTLPSDSWRKVKTEPEVGSIRSYSYVDQTSDAHIDIDLVAQSLPDGEYSYVVTIFGWPATDPRL
jgi:hypothetical protein